ncbi:MAG TPA: hypothetical protein VIE65_02525 [Methylobacter sp.]|jgi:hypothetical protein
MAPISLSAGNWLWGANVPSTMRSRRPSLTCEYNGSGTIQLHEDNSLVYAFTEPVITGNEQVLDRIQLHALCERMILQMPIT